MATETTTSDQGSPVRTGIEALDDILGGGLTPNRVYLIEGDPGSGKTTLALQFLMEGARRGEKVLYVTLSETKLELAGVAVSHGWSLNNLDIIELIAKSEELEPENQYTMFQPSEVELSVTTKAILDEVERLNPTRIVIDSLSEVRLLAQNALRYRRRILALKHFFTGRQCTVLLLDDNTSEVSDLQLQSIAHGVITLEQLAPEYGAERRRLRIMKFRGKKYRGGYHDFLIDRGGLVVFPRLVAAEHLQGHSRGLLKSGIAEFDALVGGGFDLGTSVLLLGPAGVGKSSLAIQYAKAAASRGDRAVVFTFDENLQTMLLRMSSLGLDISGEIESGSIVVQQVDPAELSPGEFAAIVRRAAEGGGGRPGAKVLVIDSLNGYLNAMPEERFLIIQLHELLSYLGHKGAVTFLIVAQHGMLGSMMKSPVDMSYLADSVVLFRYLETMGVVRQAISVVKKRSGRYERTIREFQMDDSGLHVGGPLRDFHGILSGTTTFLGDGDPLRNADDD